MWHNAMLRTQLMQNFIVAQLRKSFLDPRYGYATPTVLSFNYRKSQQKRASTLSPPVLLHHMPKVETMEQSSLKLTNDVFPRLSSALCLHSFTLLLHLKYESALPTMSTPYFKRMPLGNSAPSTGLELHGGIRILNE